MPPFPMDAVEHALRAPSVHNTQPWRWRIGEDRVELHSDPDRHLPVTDPDRRDLVLSCGAALHHLTVAMAASGVSAAVERLPDPEDRTHLATVSVGRGPATGAELFPAIGRRMPSTNRAAMLSTPLATCVARLKSSLETRKRPSNAKRWQRSNPATCPSLPRAPATRSCLTTS